MPLSFKGRFLSFILCPQHYCLLEYACQFFLPVLNLVKQDIRRVALLRTAPHSPPCNSSSSTLLLLLLFHQLPSASSHTSSPNLSLSCSCSFHLQHHLLLCLIIQHTHMMAQHTVAVKGTSRIYNLITHFLRIFYAITL
jgi:hypothetical protein